MIKKTKPAQIPLHSKILHTIIKINDFLNIDLTIAGSIDSRY